MKEIELTQGQVAIVDDEDFDALNSVKWYAHWYPSIQGFYAVRNVPIGGGKWAIIRMHRAITGAERGFDVDHVNHATLDNRKSNLRICTKSENQHNRGKTASNTSGFKGVSWNKAAGKWTAKIRLHGKLRHLGYFSDVLEAARAYDQAAIEMHGEFARHNNQEIV